MRIALDPGVTTGVAWRSAGDIHAIQWPGEAIAAVLDGFNVSPGITEIVVENFRSRPGPSVNLSAPETIGRVLAWADERGIPVIRQDASPVKRVVTKDRLRAFGGWVRGQEHARDAARHLLYRENKLGIIDIKSRDLA